MSLYILADFTRAYQDSEKGLVSTLLRICNKETEHPKVYIYHLERQSEKINAPVFENKEYFEKELIHDTGSYWTQLAQKITNRILSIAGNDPDASIKIISFHYDIRAIKNNLPQEFSNKIEATKWNDEFTDLAPSQDASEIEDIMPKQELLDVIKKAFNQRQITSRERATRLTDLRGLLDGHDRRLRKDNPAASRPGTMSQIVAYALNEGYLTKCDPTDSSKNYYLWLAEAHHDPSIASMPQPTFSDACGNRQIESANNTQTKMERSSRFIELLRRKELGPFGKIRTDLYHIIGDVFEENIKLGDLVIKINESIDYIYAELKNQYPPILLKNFIINMFQKQSIFLGNDNMPIIFSFAALNKNIVSLIPNFSVALDGVLLRTLVENISDVSIRDIDDLTGALYVERNKDNKNKVFAAVAWLLSEGLLFEKGNYLSLTQ